MPYKDLKERKAYHKKYAEDNREKFRLNSRKYQLKIKDKVFSHYGKFCKCCGENTMEFLSIDHINGKGNQHRREIQSEGGYGTYLWLVKNNFPKEFRILCYNCNLSMGFFGYCPHQRKKLWFIKKHIFTTLNHFLRLHALLLKKIKQEK